MRPVILTLLSVLLSGCGFHLVGSQQVSIQWGFDNSVTREMRDYFNSMGATTTAAKWSVHIYDVQHLVYAIRYENRAELDAQRVNQEEVQGSYQILNQSKVMYSGSFRQSGRFIETLDAPYSGERSRMLLQEELWSQIHREIYQRIKILATKQEGRASNP